MHSGRKFSKNMAGKLQFQQEHETYTDFPEVSKQHYPGVAIRFATRNDIPYLIAIYNQGVMAENANADEEPLTLEDRQEWFLEHDENHFPLYVLEKEGVIIGWGALSSYRKERSGLRTVAEISYYIDYSHHRRGYGKFLVTHMMKDCSRLHIHHLLAVVLDINLASIKLLESLGFSRWGHLPGIVNLKNKVCGQYIYGIHIS